MGWKECCRLEARALEPKDVDDPIDENDSRLELGEEGRALELELARGCKKKNHTMNKKRSNKEKSCSILPALHRLPR